MRKLLGIIFIGIFVCFSPQFGFAEEKNSITVSAAISLKNAFEEIGSMYTEKSGIKVIFNFGSSGALARQIEGGAPVDIFASAAQKDMNSIEEKGYATKNTRKNFARNALTLVVPKSSSVRIKDFNALTSDVVKRIAVGNPKTVPAGRYAAEVFDHYGISSKIKDKLIYAENVRQVLDYVVRGEVDAGVVYSTDAAIVPADLYVATIAPDSSHSPIVYPIAVVKGASNPAAARAFIELVLSKEGAAILQKFGFSKP